MTCPARPASREAKTQRRLSKKLTTIASPPDTSLAVHTRLRGIEKILVSIMNTT